jgi:hypothetical protein
VSQRYLVSNSDLGGCVTSHRQNEIAKWTLPLKAVENPDILITKARGGRLVPPLVVSCSS